MVWGSPFLQYQPLNVPGELSSLEVGARIKSHIMINHVISV